MRRSSDRTDLDDRLVEVLRDGESELTTIVDRLGEDVGPVFSTIRRFANEGVIRSPRPGVYALTETERESSSFAEASDE